MAMEFVGDYKKKQKIVEALKRQQAALAGADFGPANTETRASGAFPGMTQANWGSALAKLGAGFLGGRAADKEATAEEEAQAARMAALKNIFNPTTEPATGVTPPPTDPNNEPMGIGAMQAQQNAAPAPGPQEPFELTPEKIMALQEMGVDPSVYQHLLPEKPALGAEAQAAATKAGRKILVLRGRMTQAQADEMDAAEDAASAKSIEDEKAMLKYKAGLEYHAPTGNSRDKVLGDMYASLANMPPGTPEYQAQMARIQQFEQLNDAESAGAGGKGAGRYDPAREAAKIGDVAGQLTALIDKHGEEMFSYPQKLYKAAQDIGQENPGEYIPKILQAAGTTMESPANTVMRTLGIETTLESIAKLAPASDADIRLLLSKMPSAYNSEAGARAVITEMLRIKAKFESGGYGAADAVPGAPAAGGAADEDAQALEWARANPNDPRAQAILGGR